MHMYLNEEPANLNRNLLLSGFGMQVYEERKSGCTVFCKVNKHYHLIKHLYAAVNCERRTF